MTDTSTIQGACSNCQATFGLAQEQLTTLLSNSCITCESCKQSLTLTPEESARFRSLSSAGMVSMVAVAGAALASLVAIVLKWAEVITFEVQITVTLGAIALSWLLMSTTKKSLDLTLDLQASEQ